LPLPQRRQGRIHHPPRARGPHEPLLRPNAGIADDVFLAAIRDIKKDEEITFDYSTISADDWKMGRRCGAPCCRGVVGNYRDLPESLKAKYDKFTPAWIKALCGAVARSCRAAIAGFRRALFFFLMPSV
jgi:hypothetical protein